MTVYVVSTGNAPTGKEACLASVRAQRGVDVKHIALDAAEQHPPRGPLENLIDAMKDIPDDAIVARLDLDDRLAPRSDALQLVERMHANGALVTHGSFRFLDGREAPWFSRTYAPDEDVRKAPWLASHLRTFRAHLFKRLRPNDFKMNGKWLDHGRDLLEMLGLIQLAGHDRVTYCPEILYLYDLAASFEFSASLEELAYEKKCVEYVRSLPPYERLASL